MSRQVQPATGTILEDIPSAEATFYTVNGVTLHAIEAGDPDDPLAILLHGFPEFWYGWKDYVEPFVEAGYRVIIPDQRGYNRSDKPDGVRSYAIQELSGDIAELIRTADAETAYVAGHDWGAAVAWDLSLRHPEVLDRLGIINVPHPTVFQSTIRSNLTQLRKSWYVFYFQIPKLPEWVTKRTDYGLLADAMRDGARPGTFTSTDIDRYRQAWQRDGALTTMINWYRALLRHSASPPRERVEAPTLVVWGENDQALVPEMAGRSVDYCEDGRLETFPDATHWVNHEEADRVSELLIEHFDG